MPRTLWPGLPDATAPGTSISLDAVRSRFAVGCADRLAPMAIIRQGVNGGRHAREVLSVAMHVKCFSNLARRLPGARLTPPPQR
jgi:hypothetical protein